MTQHSKHELHQAYILHSRAYRDSSLIIELFTKDTGRIAAIAKGVRRPKAKNKALMQVFVPLLISYVGKNDLQTLCHAETNGLMHCLSGKQLFSALYLNELLVRLLQRFDPHPELFQAYDDVLHALAQKQNTEIVLRMFEKKLLQELGYGLQLEFDAVEHAAINEQTAYYFFPERGFVPSQSITQKQQLTPFLGKHILAIHANQFNDAEVLYAAKRLLRLALNPLLADKPIMSREFFSKREPISE